MRSKFYFILKIFKKNNCQQCGDEDVRQGGTLQWVYCLFRINQDLGEVKLRCHLFLIFKRGVELYMPNLCFIEEGRGSAVHHPLDTKFQSSRLEQTTTKCSHLKLFFCWDAHRLLPASYRTITRSAFFRHYSQILSTGFDGFKIVFSWIKWQRVKIYEEGFSACHHHLLNPYTNYIYTLPHHRFVVGTAKPSQGALGVGKM